MNFKTEFLLLNPSNIVLNEYFNASIGGVGVPQQRPWDVLGGLLRLPAGWSNTCPYWSSTVSQGKTFFSWVTSSLSPLLYRVLVFNVTVDDFHFFGVFRTQVSARWGSCWAAVVSVSLWPARSVWRAYPRHPLARSCSTKVRRPSLKSLKLNWIWILHYNHFDKIKLNLNSLTLCKKYSYVLQVFTAFQKEEMIMNFYFSVLSCVFLTLRWLMRSPHRLASTKVGGDRLQIPDQALQRLAASHPYSQHRPCIYWGYWSAIVWLKITKIIFFNPVYIFLLFPLCLVQGQ